MNPLYVVACGKRKKPRPAPAWQLYTGPYFGAMMAYVRLRAGLHDIAILSAKYGLVPAQRVIAPYNLKLGQPGSVDVETLRRQAAELGVAGRDVVAFGGQRYTRLAREVWPACATPLQDNPEAGSTGMPGHRMWMREQIASEMRKKRATP
jgi:hypothetical protein